MSVAKQLTTFTLFSEIFYWGGAVPHNFLTQATAKALTYCLKELLSNALISTS